MSHRAISMLLGLGAAISIAACDPKPSVTAAAPDIPREFGVRGLVRGIEAEEATLIVEHEDVPGFMPAMTMPFRVRENSELAGLRVGDAVAFRLFVAESESWIAGIAKVDPGSLQLPAPVVRAPSTGPRLKEGDRLEHFQLIDQAGRDLTRETLAGKSLLVTFIFVRCPVPEFCPRMGHNFAEIERKVSADPALAAGVRLLSISFDPQDSPPVLAEYAARFAKDPDLWRFATGDPAEITRLTHAFSVHVKPEGGTLAHGLCTALIGPDGTIQKLWRGNGWKPDEVMAALNELSAPPVADARTP